MAYVGLNPQTQLLNTSTETFSGNAVAYQFTLARAVASASDLDVMIDQTLQRPFADYTAENVSLLFQSPPGSGTNNITVTYRAGALNSLNLTANAFGAGTVGAPSVYSVAANNTGTVTDMGLLAGINVGNGLYAGLRFDATLNAWQISSNVSGAGAGTYANILTTSSTANAAGSDTQIQFNQSGTFGASGNLTFDYGNNKLTMLGYQVFGNTATPANVANAVALYSNITGSGGTGLYFTSASANDELVSKSKAIVFSIIF